MTETINFFQSGEGFGDDVVGDTFLEILQEIDPAGTYKSMFIQVFARNSEGSLQNALNATITYELISHINRNFNLDNSGTTYRNILDGSQIRILASYDMTVEDLFNIYIANVYVKIYNQENSQNPIDVCIEGIPYNVPQDQRHVLFSISICRYSSENVLELDMPSMNEESLAETIVQHQAAAELESKFGIMDPNNALDLSSGARPVITMLTAQNAVSPVNIQVINGAYTFTRGLFSQIARVINDHGACAFSEELSDAQDAYTYILPLKDSVAVACAVPNYNGSALDFYSNLLQQNGINAALNDNQEIVIRYDNGDTVVLKDLAWLLTARQIEGQANHFREDLLISEKGGDKGLNAQQLIFIAIFVAIIGGISIFTAHRYMHKKDVEKATKLPNFDIGKFELDNPKWNELMLKIFNETPLEIIQEKDAVKNPQGGWKIPPRDEFNDLAKVLTNLSYALKNTNDGRKVIVDGLMQKVDLANFLQVEFSDGSDFSESDVQEKLYRKMNEFIGRVLFFTNDTDGYSRRNSIYREAVVQFFENLLIDIGNEKEVTQRNQLVQKYDALRTEFISQSATFEIIPILKGAGKSITNRLIPQLKSDFYGKEMNISAEALKKSKEKNPISRDELQQEADIVPIEIFEAQSQSPSEDKKEILDKYAKELAWNTARLLKQELSLEEYKEILFNNIGEEGIKDLRMIPTASSLLASLISDYPALVKKQLNNHAFSKEIQSHSRHILLHLLTQLNDSVLIKSTPGTGGFKRKALTITQRWLAANGDYKNAAIIRIRDKRIEPKRLVGRLHFTEVEIQLETGDIMTKVLCVLTENEHNKF